MSIIKRLKYWWFRRRNWYPCQQEMCEIYARVSSDRLIYRKYGIVLSYCLKDATIITVAEDWGVTRERVRQILMKVYHEDKCHQRMECNVREASEI